MKKLFTFIIGFVLTIAMIFTVNAFALTANVVASPSPLESVTPTPSDKITVSASPSAQEVKRGETFTLTVNISGEQPVKDMMLSVVYDKMFFELTGGKWLIDGVLKDFQISNNGGVIAFSEKQKLSGEVIVFTFKVKETSLFNSSQMSCRATLRGDNNAQLSVDDATATMINVICDHAYGEKLKHNENEHKQICSICGDVITEAHIWDEGAVSKEPDCKDEGTMLHTCTACGETKQEPIPVTTVHAYGEWQKNDAENHKHICTVCGKDELEVHTWDEGTVTKEPDCKDEGEMTYSCTVCGETKKAPISKTEEHKYGEWQKNDAENHKHICTVCGKEELEVHTWDEGTVTKEPTCKDEGERTYSCTACGETKIESVPVTDIHTYGEKQKHDAENHKQVCTLCGSIITEAHTWDEGKITRESTCKDEGEKTYFCTACGETKTEPVPVTDDHTYGEWQKGDAENHKHICTVCGKDALEAHTWDEGKITKESTCKDEGEKTYSCTVCGETKTEPVPVTDIHTYGEKQKHDAENHKQVCTLCGSIITETHTWDEGKITKESTCKDKGERTHSCKMCGETKIESVPITDNHTYGEKQKHDAESHKQVCTLCGSIITEAHTWDEGKITKGSTCKDEGERTHSCKICGEIKTVSVPKTEDHTFGEWEKHDADVHSKVCTLCGIAISEQHEWNKGRVTATPNCTFPGERLFDCNECGETKTEPIGTNGEHSYGQVKIKDAEYHESACINCGDVISGKHTWNEGYVYRQPTCKKEGSATYTCTQCDYQEDRAITKTNDHTYGEWKPIEGGLFRRICLVCGIDDVKPHIWDDGELIKAPTCKDEGEMLHICRICGEKDVVSVPKTNDHNLGNYKYCNEDEHCRTCNVCGTDIHESHKWEFKAEITRPTCQNEGENAFYCNYCYTEKQVILPMSDHVPGDWIVAKVPTCTRLGSREQACLKCEEVLSEEAIPARGHLFVEWHIEGSALTSICECGEKSTKSFAALQAAVASRLGSLTPNNGTLIPSEASFSMLNKLKVHDAAEINEYKDKVEALRLDGDLIAAYDIIFKYLGSTLDINGSSEIKLVIPEEYLDKYDNFEVFFIGSDGEAHAVEAKRVENTLVFDTDRYSDILMIGNNRPNDIVKSGDLLKEAIIFICIAFAVLAAVLVTNTVLMSKRSKKG